MSTESRSSLLHRWLLAALVPVSLLVTGCGGPNLLDRLSATQWGFWGTVVIVLDIVALVDLLGDDHRSTSNMVIWVLIIVFFPVVGVILYFLLDRD